MTPAVVFDLGKVLLDFDYVPVLRHIAAHSRTALPELKQLLDQGPLLHAYERGELDSPAFHRAVAEATGLTTPYPVFARLFGDIFTGIPEMIALHAALRGAGVPTFVFSNTNDLAIQHVRRTFPFFNAFDGHVLSYEHGVMKPDPRLYEVVESVTGCRGADLVYLDDREENVAAGDARGWRVVHHAEAAATAAALRSYGLPV
ncbi:MAG: HAD family hydrolase [Limisphaerales bacterium]